MSLPKTQLSVCMTELKRYRWWKTHSRNEIVCIAIKLTNDRLKPNIEYESLKTHKTFDCSNVFDMLMSWVSHEKIGRLFRLSASNPFLWFMENMKRKSQRKSSIHIVALKASSLLSVQMHDSGDVMSCVLYHYQRNRMHPIPIDDSFFATKAVINRNRCVPWILFHAILLV